VHLIGVRLGSLFQNGATVFKLSLVTFVVVAGLCAGRSQPIHFGPMPGDGALFGHPAFALSLVYVMYAYTGWNAATYIVGEIRDPARNVPRALLIGTALVALLYILLNAVFLRTTPIAELRGQVEVGLIAGKHIFGEGGGRIVGGFICVGLLATISAMTWVGPRAAATMGEDHAALRWLAARSGGGAPRHALLVQLLIVAGLIVSSSFERVLVFIQFPLTLCSGAVVIGLMVLRFREPKLARPFRVPLYPLPPLIFLAISGWMLVHTAQEKPRESAAGTLAMLSGLAVYYLPRRRARSPGTP
jgi:APA family basic amino acid/polyamine antiporter